MFPFPTLGALGPFGCFKASFFSFFFVFFFLIFIVIPSYDFAFFLFSPPPLAAFLRRSEMN